MRLRPKRISDTERPRAADGTGIFTPGQSNNQPWETNAPSLRPNQQGGPPWGEQRAPMAPPAAASNDAASTPGTQLEEPSREQTQRRSGHQTTDRGATSGRAAGADGPAGGDTVQCRQHPGAPWRRRAKGHPPEWDPLATV